MFKSAFAHLKWISIVSFTIFSHAYLCFASNPITTTSTSSTSSYPSPSIHKNIYIFCLLIQVYSLVFQVLLPLVESHPHPTHLYHHLEVHTHHACLYMKEKHLWLLKFRAWPCLCLPYKQPTGHHTLICIYIVLSPPFSKIRVFSFLSISSMIWSSYSVFFITQIRMTCSLSEGYISSTHGHVHFPGMLGFHSLHPSSFSPSLFDTWGPTGNVDDETQHIVYGNNAN